MEIIVSAALIEKAQTILDSGEFKDRAEVSLGEGGPVAILSADPNAIIPLHELKHGNRSYYLGLSKE